MSRLEPGSIFDPTTHYSEDYYGEGAGLEHVTPAGNWITYRGPTKRWEGFKNIAESLRAVCVPSSAKLLDIGCSSGSFVQHAVASGIEAYGVDLSESAIGSANSIIRDRLICSDVTLPSTHLKALAPFDFLTSWDFWEHIFDSDLDSLISHSADLLRPGGLFINIICTVPSVEQEIYFDKGVKFSAENSWLLCSGHVNMRTWDWWSSKLEFHGLRPRHDIAYKLQIYWQSIGFSSPAWSFRNLVVAERT